MRSNEMSNYDRYVSKLRMISMLSERREAFAKNFNMISLRHFNIDLFKETLSFESTLLKLNEIKTVCSNHNKNVADVCCLLYTPNILHILFVDETCLSISSESNGIIYSLTKDAKSTWVRMQAFFYRHTSRAISHAKGAPASEKGLTLDQFINRY